MRGNHATFQIPSKVGQVIEFGTATDLEQQLQLLVHAKIDAIFHAAAVNDFQFGKVWTRLPSGELAEVQRGKFSTREGPLLAELIPAPKLITKLRGWFPKTWLAGWKYEVEGDRAAAAERARIQISESQTDAGVVNGPAYGPGFGLLAKESEFVHIANSPALFECLERRLPHSCAILE